MAFLVLQLKEWDVGPFLTAHVQTTMAAPADTSHRLCLCRTLLVASHSFHSFSHAGRGRCCICCSESFTLWSRRRYPRLYLRFTHRRTHYDNEHTSQKCQASGRATSTSQNKNRLTSVFAGYWSWRLPSIAFETVPAFEIAGLGTDLKIFMNGQTISSDHWYHPISRFICCTHCSISALLRERSNIHGSRVDTS